MKSYSEMAENVLRRSEEIKAKRDRSKKLTVKILCAVLPCIILTVSVLSFINFYNDRLSDGLSVDKEDIVFLNENFIMSDKLSGVGYKTIGELPYNMIYGGVSDSSIIGGSSGPLIEGTVSSSLPLFYFPLNKINVVARAVEELNGEYETLPMARNMYTKKYRAFRMKVIESFDSNLTGEFIYLLESDLKGDLTEYDALMISMQQTNLNYIFKNNNRLVSFETAFFSPEAELGKIIAFSNGVFDEALWQDRSWYYGYQFGDKILDNDDEECVSSLMVKRGTSLEEAIENRNFYNETASSAYSSYHFEYDFESEEVLKVLDYVKPFKNGVFVPDEMSFNNSNPSYTRYINGCLTNEKISITLMSDGTEKVTHSDFKFEASDFENLPSLADYIEKLDLNRIEPQHMSQAEKDISDKIIKKYVAAVGYYEKTENGVLSIVRICWKYIVADGMADTEYYDETFVLLDENGARVVSIEKLNEMIGYNKFVSDGEYGEPIVLPYL